MVLYPRIVKESFAEIEPHGDEFIAYFYGCLFAETPELRGLFPPMMDAHREVFLRAFGRIVCSLDSPDALASFLAQLGRGHRKYGVVGEHYDAIGRALLIALRKFAENWSDEIAAAWTTAFASVAETMTAAVQNAADPPWWIGDVVSHEKRAHDIAVLTVRPHQPLPYHAGQYLSVQTARWPRVWRPYSIANAPRADGTISLHVRAQPGGWVSGALVRHTAVGDKLLLGPAAGSMTLDPAPDRDLLFVAGGTGLAPLKALVEQAIRSHRGEIRLFVGARTAAELYDLPGLRRLEADCPRLRVTPVVSGDDAGDGYDGMRGLVAEAVEGAGDWSEHDVYVAGPEAMIGRTIATLHRMGVPPSRVRHDPPPDVRPIMTRPAARVGAAALLPAGSRVAPPPARTDTPGDQAEPARANQGTGPLPATAESRPNPVEAEALALTRAARAGDGAS
jgi:NAD(P)H-flavin reductase/hemoglobin-like flavoprotein